MRSEKSLSDALDKLAESKARDHARKAVEAAMTALEKYWMHNGEHVGQYVTTCLYARIEGGGCSWLSKPDEKTVAVFRATILKELLEKLPLVKELATLQLNDQQGEEPS